jgi:DNA repair protein RecN (Recombination protein N)
MLTELRIVNFALIEQVHLQFQPGFTVLTGETGAGKSLLIDAIGLLVGGRASAEQIRSGEEEAQLEAAFHLSDGHPVVRQLRAEGLIGPADSGLILKRVLARSGRHRIYLNGGLCPLKVLEALGGTLVDIHGQHEQQSLLSIGKQLEALDAFGGLHQARGQYQEAYRTWKNLTAQLEAMKDVGTDRARLEELLRFQVQEIEQAGLHIDEEESLQLERGRLVHASRLRELAEAAYAELYQDEEGILTRLGRIGRLLAELGQTDPAAQDTVQQAAEASIQLKDLAGRLRNYADHMEADPDRQAVLEDRLDLIQRLKKKYGGSMEAILTAGDRAKAELLALESRESRSAEVTAQIQAAVDVLSRQAEQLSKKRRAAAKRLMGLVKTELAALKMEQTQFEVTLSCDGGPETFGPLGCDHVEFLLSSNAGEPPRPLSRIASGGELSRIMLALKTVLAERDHVPVLVFDEIDQGVGGAVAAAMGIRLRKLGAFHQVFCITHLPQVASQAEHHWLVAKGQENGRTTTSAKRLNGIGREEEIARMLGGVTITKKVRETAAELIAGAKDQS